MQGSYLFCWNKIPGNDNGRLIEFLIQNFGIDWIKTAIIKKIDAGKTIRVYTEKNFLSLRLNDEKTKVYLKIDDGRINEFFARIENSELNIYQGSKYIISFYTEERWQNWINKVKESGFKLDDQEKGAVFVYMEDNVVLACLKVIAKYDKNLLSKEDALKYLNEIKEIVLKKIEPISEDIDLMLESLQLSLMGVFASCECYVEKAFEKTKSLEKLIESAAQAEKEENLGAALGHTAEIGANILAGEKLDEKDLEGIPEGLVAEWLDGIDSLSAAMVGDTINLESEPDELAEKMQAHMQSVDLNQRYMPLKITTKLEVWRRMRGQNLGLLASAQQKTVYRDKLPASLRPLRVFLCHSSGDKPPVRDLYTRLLAEGFDPWLDEEKLVPGQKWKIEIPKAVRASDVVIICLSRGAINKAGYIQKEIKFALDVAEEQPEDKIFLIPLKLEECDVPERLRDWQWVNLFEETGFERLIRALRKRTETISAEGIKVQR